MTFSNCHRRAKNYPEKRTYLRWAMKVLSTANESTCNGQRKYFHFLGQICYKRDKVQKHHHKRKATSNDSKMKKRILDAILIYRRGDKISTNLELFIRITHSNSHASFPNNRNVITSIAKSHRFCNI